MAIDESILKRICNGDLKATPEWLAQQATNTGNDLHDIALKFHNGDGVTKNRDKARQWHEKAFEKGCAVASRNLGLLYEFGHGIPETRLNSLLGLIYSYDYGVPKDYVKAAQCYQQAIDRGYANAQKDLDRLLLTPDISAENLNTIGVMYIYAKGVIANDAIAMACLKKAKKKAV